MRSLSLGSVLRLGTSTIARAVADLAAMNIAAPELMGIASTSGHEPPLSHRQKQRINNPRGTVPNRGRRRIRGRNV